jgi:hypothetical protein
MADVEAVGGVLITGGGEGDEVGCGEVFYDEVEGGEKEAVRRRR